MSQLCRGAIRRWQPPPWGPQAQAPREDAAARALAGFAARLLERVPAIVRAVSTASHGVVCRQAYRAQSPVEDRAWQCTFADVPLTCVIEEGSERELLALIVGGAPQGRLSAIERRIASEVIARLLGSCADERPVLEVVRTRPAAPTWHCPVRLSSETGHVNLALYAGCVAADPPVTIHPHVAPVTVALRALLPAGPCRFLALTRLRPGETIALALRANNLPAAMLFGGNRRLARGGLGSWLGGRAILLTDVAQAR